MSRALRTLLSIVLGVAGCAALGAAALFVIVDRGAVKRQLEADASRSLGMQVQIAGGVRPAWRPSLAVSLDDVHISQRGAEIALLPQVTLGIEALALLRGELRITRLELNRPRLMIERGRDGRFNIEAVDAATGALAGLDWSGVSMVGASITYADKRWAQPIEAIDCRVDLRDLRATGAALSRLIKDASFSADVACGELHHDTVRIKELRFSAAARHGVLELTSLTARAFDAPGTGRFQADFSGATPSYRLECAFKQLPIEAFFKALSLPPEAAGRVDFAATLSMQGQTGKALRQTLAGRVTLRSRNATLGGRNLDEALSRFESSQRFSLVDAGAFFLVGPLGLVLSKGYDFANLYRSSGGSSSIQALVSDWRVERGVARAEDVAMATQKYRIALHGALDLVQQRFDGVSLALVDAKGCVVAQQQLHGSFQQPVVEQPGLLRALAGPALSLLRQGRELLPGAGCEVFYAGAVAAPG
jgi:AsmA protein